MSKHRSRSIQIKKNIEHKNKDMFYPLIETFVLGSQKNHLTETIL